MQDDNCLFCRMIRGELDATVVYEDDHVFAFRDIDPKAPTHILIIPREHIATINDLEPRHAETVGQLYLAAQRLAREEGIAEEGYRVVMNCNAGAGQSVYHIHLHLLGGRQLTWPPG